MTFEPDIIDLMRQPSREAVLDALLNRAPGVSALDAPDKDGLTALHWAIRRGWNDVVALLLKSGADPLKSDEEGRGALHDAAYCCNGRAVELLLAAGVPVDARNPRTGETALHQAILQKSLPAVMFLVRCGADPGQTLDLQENRAMNAYHLACESTPAILDFMLQQPERDLVRASFEGAKQPLDGLRYALLRERVDILDILMRFGLPLNEPDAAGVTPMHFLLRHRKNKDKALQMIEKLHQAGADVHDTCSGGGETLLMAAARDGFTAAFFFLAAQGADPRAVNSGKENALHFAAQSHGAAAMIEALVRFGVDIDAQDVQGRTAFHVAAHQNRRENVEKLLALGCNPLLADRKGRTAEQICQSPVQRHTRAAVIEGQQAWRKRATSASGRRFPAKIRSSKPGQNRG